MRRRNTACAALAVGSLRLLSQRPMHAEPWAWGGTGGSAAQASNSQNVDPDRRFQ
jgi:hypothetical protein